MTISENIKKKQMKDFRNRWQAMVEIEAEEQKKATIKQRWQQLNAILSMAIGLGFALEESQEDDKLVYQRWEKLKGSMK